MPPALASVCLLWRAYVCKGYVLVVRACGQLRGQPGELFSPLHESPYKRPKQKVRPLGIEPRTLR